MPCKDASEVIQCIKRAIESEVTDRALEGASSALKKSEFVLQSHGQNLFGTGYRFEQSLHGIIVQDSLVSVNVEKDTNRVLDITLKLAVVPASSPAVAMISAEDAISAAVSSVKKLPSNKGIEFIAPPTTTPMGSASANPRLVFLQAEGVWHLAYDIEVRSASGWNPPNPRMCRSYRAFVDALSKETLEVVSLLG